MKSRLASIATHPVAEDTFSARGGGYRRAAQRVGLAVHMGKSATRSVQH